MKQEETGRPTYPVFHIPVLFASLTVFGLVAGLVGEGWLDVLSWAGLGIPALVCVYKSF